MEIRTRRPLWGCQRWIFFAFFNDMSVVFSIWAFASRRSRMETWNCPRIPAHVCVGVQSPLILFLCLAAVMWLSRSLCSHLFGASCCFGLSHNQGLLIGGRLQNEKLFIGFVNACNWKVPCNIYSLFILVSNGATPRDSISSFAYSALCLQHPAKTFSFSAGADIFSGWLHVYEPMSVHVGSGLGS